MRVLRRLYQFVRPYRPWAVLALVSMAIVALSTASLIALVQPLFDEVLTGESAPAASTSNVREVIDGDPRAREVVTRVESTRSGIAQWWRENRAERWKVVLGLLLILFVLRSASMFFSEYAFQKVGLSTIRDLRNRLYDTIIHQSNRFFSRRATGELVSRVVSDVEAIQGAVSVRIGDLFQESLTLLAIGGVIIFANAELAVFTFLVAPVIAFPVAHFGRRLRRTTRKSQERMADIATILEETIKGVRIVKAFAMERFEISRFHEATRRHLAMNLKAHRIQALTSPVLELLAGICTVLLFGYAAIRIRAGALTLGQFMSFLVALAGMYAPIKRLNKVNLAMNTAISAAERVFQMLDVDNEVRERPDATELSSIQRSVVYDQVEFAYENEPVLRDVNLTVRPGEMVAIVGGSGTGKSTLVNLLPRFYDVTGGRILIDDVDIRDATLVSLRNLIGYVTQEVILFNDTVRNNIAYGRADISMESIIDAARAANAHQFIELLPNGYDSLIGESGVLLSGGQRQRLAIARALLKNPPILILDEATSALDTESERLVQQALANLMQGRTTLVIAHRLSTVRRADKIVVLDRGSIREEGTHDELLASRGTYRRLYDMQFLEDETMHEALP